MARMTMTRGKFEGIQACADERGVIAAAAMDQRGSLKNAIARVHDRQVDDGALTEFKIAVTRILSRYSSAILMDPEYGLPALEQRAPDTGVLLAYEKSGYDMNARGRLPALLDLWNVRRLKEAGANAIKLLLYYNPFDDPRINECKHVFVERVGAECAASDIALFLEPIAYDDRMDIRSLEFANVKPRYVSAAMEEFSKPQYRVDVLMVEVPVLAQYVEGMRAFRGEKAYDREEALALFRQAASVARKPFIYLSAGMSIDVLIETLELAGESDVPFAGLLCGRATWQESLPVYGQKGLAALEAWLEDRGARNLQTLNQVVARGASPWWAIYGGLEQIEVV